MLTRNEHKKLINNEIFLTEDEKEKVIEFDKYIENSYQYRPYISPRNEEIIKSYEREISFLESLSELNQNQQEAVNRKKKMNIISLAERRKQKKEKETQFVLQRTKKHDKIAGYINASAILFVVANMGLFLATLLLITK